MIDNLGIYWFRQDLRLNDNLALNSIVEKSDYIIPIYIVDENFNLGGASKWWLHSSLRSLDASLREKNSKLFFFKGDPKEILKKLIYDYKIKSIYWNRLYDKLSIKTDTEIKNIFNSKDVEIVSFKGSLINEPWTTKNKSGAFFKVFTPYWNKCLENIKPIKLLKSPEKIKTIFIKSPLSLPLEDLKLVPKNSKWTKLLSFHWVAGEKQALKNFNYFKNNILENYEMGRDRPDKNYTSKLSPHLHFGEISAEKIFLEIYKKKILAFKSKKKFLAEIGWREFSYNLLFNYPHIRTNPIKEKFKKFPWKKNAKHLKAWQNGKTGFPIVDAGMRQLYQTGWMHNRVRMIVGSFLCKNLLIHWREGEKWFFDKLVDADIASNSAGWQWIAGCGADAAPYFRVFNPLTQGLKFDSDGKYVKKFIPELEKIPSNRVHAPWKLDENDQLKFNCILGKHYPKPIVSLSESRERALEAFSTLKMTNYE